MLPAVIQTEEHHPAIITGLPTSQELLVYQTWAKNAAESQMYRNVGKEAGIMMIMLAAREYGIGPAQALNGGLHIIEGKVELSARVMSALIRRAKHQLKIVESTSTRCTIAGKRSDTGETHTVTYTIEDAQLAGLIKDKGGWKRTPSDMLYARTISKLARQLFSDVIGIGYVEGEIIDSRGVSDDSRGIVEPEVIQSETESLFDKILKEFPQSDRPHFVNFRQKIAKQLGQTPEYTDVIMFGDLEKTKTSFKIYMERMNEKVVHSIERVSDIDNSSVDT